MGKKVRGIKGLSPYPVSEIGWINFTWSLSLDNVNGHITSKFQLSLLQTSWLAGGHHEENWTNKPYKRDDRDFPLDHPDKLSTGHLIG